MNQIGERLWGPTHRWYALALFFCLGWQTGCTGPVPNPILREPHAEAAPTPSATTKPTPQTAHGEQSASAAAFTPHHQWFSTAGEALGWVVSHTKPKVIGFGEFHQQNDTIEVLSAIERFTKTLLPLMAKVTSDLVVETWVSTGSCGQTEQKLTADVDKVTERPETTEDENITLLKRAVALGVAPHILELNCADYQALFDADGGVDYFGLLSLIGKRIEEKSLALLARPVPLSHLADTIDNKSTRSSINLKKRIIAIYGGAIHNDVAPTAEWAAVSFGPGLSRATNGRYVEVDLYVPELIAQSSFVRQEPWYPFVEQHAAPNKVLLIELRQNSYVLIFEKGVKNPKLPASQPATTPQ